jgi:glycosyltransferase involved in cell wall biosynthesis
MIKLPERADRISQAAPMRIGFVSIYDVTDARAWSGIPSQILKELRAQGIEVEIISPLSQTIKFLLTPSKLIAKAKGEKRSFDHLPFVLRSYARQIESHIRRHPVDVIFSTSTIPITLLECKAPIIVWTDAVFHLMFDYYGGPFTNMSKDAVDQGKWQEETALERCAIAAYSSTWAMETAKQLTDAAKVRLLPFGSSVPVRHAASDIAASAKRKRETRKNQCELLFVGVDWERKGGETAVKTAQLLNESGIATRLKVVGCRPQAIYPPYVEFAGFIDKNGAEGQERIAAMFREADFFILPTKSEAAGVVFSEASSFGLPSLAYATGGVPDYVRNGVNGECLPAGSPASEFAERIKNWLSDAAQYEALAVRAFGEYEERLNWRKSVERLIQFCRNARDSASSFDQRQNLQAARN